MLPMFLLSCEVPHLHGHSFQAFASASADVREHIGLDRLHAGAGSRVRRRVCVRSLELKRFSIFLKEFLGRDMLLEFKHFMLQRQRIITCFLPLI